MLDIKLLEEAARLAGEKTWSATIMRALDEFVKQARVRGILTLRGSGLWSGDLREMRDDSGRRRRSRR